MLNARNISEKDVRSEAGVPARTGGIRVKVRAAVLRQRSWNASKSPARRLSTAVTETLRRAPVSPTQAGARASSGQARRPHPSELRPGRPPEPRCAYPREAAAPGARGHRGGASSALRAQDRHLAAGVGRAAQAARSHTDPRTPSAPTPGPPPTHPGLHLPSSGARSVLATPVPRTGAPPRRGRSEPPVQTGNPAAFEHAQRARAQPASGRLRSSGSSRQSGGEACQPIEGKGWGQSRKGAGQPPGSQW